MVVSETTSGEKKSWLYVFVILLLVSFSIFSVRMLNIPFLMLDFEVVVVYVPTILAGIILLAHARSKREN